ncbi:putative GEM-like protein 8 [Tasmannia lanceolata]|uniref:putative GEM-like protein 8 n=1 Tax=Tasmannia lanceolata TaxID=3420 RepID=UPI004064A57F
MRLSLGPNFSETVKGKLSLWARILQGGGVEKVFKQIFIVGETEKLLKSCQCYLSTTAGPISGMLFISNEKIAFSSDGSLAFCSANGGLVRIPNKVLIPIWKLNRINPSVNVNKPTQKYIQLVTVDNFEFWFLAYTKISISMKNVLRT